MSESSNQSNNDNKRYVFYLMYLKNVDEIKTNINLISYQGEEWPSRIHQPNIQKKNIQYLYQWNHRHNRTRDFDDHIIKLSDKNKKIMPGEVVSDEENNVWVEALLDRIKQVNEIGEDVAKGGGGGGKHLNYPKKTLQQFKNKGFEDAYWDYACTVDGFQDFNHAFNFFKLCNYKMTRNFKNRSNSIPVPCLERIKSCTTANDGKLWSAIRSVLESLWLYTHTIRKDINDYGIAAKDLCYVQNSRYLMTWFDEPNPTWRTSSPLVQLGIPVFEICVELISNQAEEDEEVEEKEQEEEEKKENMFDDDEEEEEKEIIIQSRRHNKRKRSVSRQRTRSRRRSKRLSGKK
jgi:hypothetical protein